MNNNLYTFGCSFTEDFKDNYPPYLEYKNFKGGTYPKVWPTLLSEKLNYELVNEGRGASGNQNIFTSLCKLVHQFKKGDIVIVEWSFMERYRLSDSHGFGWVHIGPPGNENVKVIGNDMIISRECQDYISINRMLKPYREEIYDYENIIDCLANSVGFEVYYWTIINDLIYDRPKELLHQKKYLLNDKIKDQFDNAFSIVLKNGGQWISEETNKLIDDGHMGEKGHQVQAKLFYDHIMSYKTNSL